MALSQEKRRRKDGGVDALSGPTSSMKLRARKRIAPINTVMTRKFHDRFWILRKRDAGACTAAWIEYAVLRAGQSSRIPYTVGANASRSASACGSHSTALEEQLLKLSGSEILSHANRCWVSKDCSVFEGGGAVDAWAGLARHAGSPFRRPASAPGTASSAMTTCIEYQESGKAAQQRYNRC